MKSREEYQASIFAKRDALLKKHKRNVAVAASALFIAVGISATAVFAPQYPESYRDSLAEETAQETTYNAENVSNSAKNHTVANAPAAENPNIGKPEIQPEYDGTANPGDAEETRGDYSSEEVSAVAFGFLTEEQKKEVLDPKAEIITVSNSGSEESCYEVFFETENGGYKVKLSTNTLDFIETKAVSSISAKISQSYISEEY